MTRPFHRRPATNPVDRHRAWLELVDREGPFLAIPALKRVWASGIASISDTAKSMLADAKTDFDRAWDAYTRAAGSTRRDTDGLEQYSGARDKWVTTVLRDVAGWEELLTWDVDSLPGGAPQAFSADRRGQVTATGALVRGSEVGALLLVVDPVDSLRDPYDDDWSASPIDRMDTLLRSTDHRIGVVTDGRWWGIVAAQPDNLTASGIVDAQTWIEEPDVRNAFFALLAVERFFGGKTTDRLAALFEESKTAEEDITVALGTQVRRAVELLVTAIADAGLDATGSADSASGPLPTDRSEVYDAAVTIMMRVVFLLFAEERSMMPESVLFTSAYGISTEHDRLDARLHEEGAEALDATHHTWHRLLATSRALYSGVNTEDMRLPAYGGSLFDADRFGWLDAMDDDGALRIAVSDRVMLAVLRSVQFATVSNESRRISFRDIGVEQIGYIYEGLLGYTTEQVDDVIVGLLGKDGEEPEIPLSVLEDLWEQYDGDANADKKALTALTKWVKENQSAAKLKPNSVSGLARKLNARIDDADRALLAVTRDEDLTARLRPYLGLIRRDLRNRPVVIQPGGLVVVETRSRANAGAHYTPKSLTQKIVLHTLEPLVYAPGPRETADRDAWVPIASNQILSLKVADIACGSGAFLVAAAEYLADRLVEAWHREGIAFGTPHELMTKALRQVVAQCLYGADINAMAVEMCKLSLWLVSLDPGRPFSFVDDKVLHGNSLLGVIDLQQLEALHIDPSRVKTFLDKETAYSEGALFGEGSEASGVELLDIRGKVRALAELRRQIAGEIDESDPARSARTKNRLWASYQQQTAALATVADGVIAAGLDLGGKPGKALDEKYATLRIAVDRAYAADDPNRTMLDGIVDGGLTPTVDTDDDRWKPLHWALAVPDVFEHGGFDAIIGNPPFLGGQKLTGSMGTNVRDWFVHVLAGGTRGSADLVAYFFLRATSLLSAKGTLGMIATNTIGQGGTREVGLDSIEAGGFTITRSIQSDSWKTPGAHLEVAVVWGTRGVVADEVPRVADGLAVRRITTLLEPAGRVEGRPVRLEENKDIAFQGCIVLGMGFVIEPDEAQEWIAADPKNAEVLFPYLNGEDLNQRPDASARRWVIDFNDRDEHDAAEYRLPYARVQEQVKPKRMENNRQVYRDYWWQFGEKRPSMRRAIADMSEVLVIARLSKTVMPLRVPTGQVASEQTVVFATDDYGAQAVLSSSLHQIWAVTYGSTLETRVRYTPSDVFETFPRPEPTRHLEQAGRTLDGERREIMLRRGLGLTKLYNLVNDPEVQHDDQVNKLRELHVEIDVATVSAFGWDDVPLQHGFHTYRQAERWSLGPTARVELLDRLLETNYQRQS